MQKENLVNSWRNAKIANEKTLEAFVKVPRELFVLQELREVAYEDYPLPILCGKTISQPTTTIIMINALELRDGDRVLEIGTGSGYHAALIATAIGSNGKVYSLEVVPELVSFSRDNLKRAGIKNVTVMEEDGSQGYPKEAPFDRIIITAACPEIPKPLIDQLNIGGVLVGPVGPIHTQEMVKLRKTSRGIEKEGLGEFVFLPMVGKHGFREEELEQLG
ncbi:protein-L-isoaspartate(D-aspartate) O-methyltransferase [Candidatus Woesearchaeota archaeon]|nr:protein-L-isoaspartate(D-aspartate) O-methyltransferase [Candidatus Woesearchaeota archaeon]